MVRSWGIVALTGAAQPWFGDVLTAAITATKLPDSGMVTVKVASTAKYQMADRITIDPALANKDTMFVERIVDATTLLCSLQGPTGLHPHASGSFLQLAVPAATIFIQLTNTAVNPLYLGVDNTITNAPSGNVFRMLLPNQSGSPDLNIGANTARTDDGWMVGTAGDSAIVAFQAV